MQNIAISFVTGGIGGICAGVTSARLAVRILTRRSEFEVEPDFEFSPPTAHWSQPIEGWPTNSKLPTRQELFDRRAQFVNHFAERRRRGVR